MVDINNTNPSRTETFTRNENLESLLKDINANLWVSEQKIISEKPLSNYPVILILGPMRSGTTLFMQWLANLGIFSYPTNLLSRFYNAPIIGAKIQLLLTDPRYNFRDELTEFINSPDYQSQNGKTLGALAPNEFWYFWRRFLSDPNRDVWSDNELSLTMDTKTLLAELAGIMDVFGKPFAAKGMLFNYNIPFLNSIFENVLFVQIKRDLVSNVASVLDARKNQLGNASKWYSFKIPEYDLLYNLDPVTQVCGQVHYINKAVESGLALVDDSRKLLVKYEDFCTNPELYYMQMIEKLNLKTSEGYRGPSSFKITRSNNNAITVDIERALKNFKEKS